MMAAAWDSLLRTTVVHRNFLSRSKARVKGIGGHLGCGAVRVGVVWRQSQACGRSVGFIKKAELRRWSLTATKQDDVPGEDASEGKGEDGNFSHSKPGGDDGVVDQALNLDGKIPSTSDQFLKTVSSRAYDMRRHLQQNMDASSYDVLEANPWRESSKPVYVLAKEEDQLLTMRTRRARSEVEMELGLLFPKRGNRRGKRPPRADYENVQSSVPANTDNRFRMSVEDVREGVLVFEDQEEAARYCSLLDGQGCMGVAELDASDVFAICQKTQALAVVFRRGQTPPQPDRLQLNLKARKRSLED